MELADRWPLRGAEDVRDRLLEAYGDPTRGYHDRRHLTEVLDRLEELAAAGESFDRLAVELAAWFHDAVYAGAPDDEERSARLAASELDAAGVPADVVAEVVRLVLVTAEHRPDDGDPDGAALSDADLGILAADPDALRGVRRQRASRVRPRRRRRLPRRSAGGARGAGREAHLFHTAAARERWEDAARANLAARARPPGLRRGRAGSERRPSAQRALEGEGAGLGVEAGVHAERERAVARHVAHGQSGHERHPEGGETVQQQRLGLTGLAAAGEVAQRDAPDVVEPAGAQQLGDLAVEPVRRLADVLEQRDAVGGGADERRPGAAGQDGEVAADDGALGVPWRAGGGWCRRSWPGPSAACRGASAARRP